MNTALITFAIFVCMLCGLAVGIRSRNVLPLFQIKGDSKDIMITATGMLATLVALIIGLLLTSAKNSYDDASNRLTEGGAKAITLNFLLSEYGPEADRIRNQLHSAVIAGMNLIWNTSPKERLALALNDDHNSMAKVFRGIQALAPVTDSQKYLKPKALELCADLLHARWMMVEQTQADLPPPFIVVLTFWLTVLFAQFGLLSPQNRTTVTILLVCALSVSSAIYFIMELNHPLEGPIKLSQAPLEKVLSLMRKP